MRPRYQLLLFLLCAFIGARAQADTVSGYLLTPDNDTVYRRLLLCALYNNTEEEACFFRALPALEGDSIRVYTPGELKGFGFRYGQKIIHYRTIRFAPRKPYFARARVIGKNLNLFADYYKKEPMEFGINRGPGSVFGSTAAQLQSYLLQDVHGCVIQLNGTRSVLRNQLKRFLRDRPDLLPLVNEFVGDLRAISFFVQQANEL